MPAIVQMTLKAHYLPTGAAIDNVLHYVDENGTAPTVADLSGLDGQIDAAGKLGAFINGMTTNWYLDTEVFIDVKDPNGAQLTHYKMTSGGQVPAEAPPEIAAVLRKHTAQRGRKHRGRFFLAPIEVDALDSDNGSIAPGNLANLASAVDFIQSTVVAGARTWKPCICHGTGPTATYTLITSVDCSQLTGVQRRRRMRVPN